MEIWVRIDLQRANLKIRKHLLKLWKELKNGGKLKSKIFDYKEHTFNLYIHTFECHLMNEWLNAASLSLSLVSHTCQLPSSPHIPPLLTKWKMLNQWSQCQAPVWMTDLNKMGKAPLGNKKLAFIQQQADSISILISFFSHSLCVVQSKHSCLKAVWGMDGSNRRRGGEGGRWESWGLGGEQC